MQPTDQGAGSTRPSGLVLCALCAVGSESVLGNELKRLSFKLEPVSRPGMVFFRSDRGGVSRAHLWLRTAERLLLVLGSFPAADFDGLFEGIRALPWEEHCRADSRVVIQKLRVSRSRINSATAAQSIAQKAVYERLGKAFGRERLPETGAASGIRIYVESDSALVGLDLSGEPLHRRGYRRISGQAPLKETIAAALVLRSGWKRRYALHDPFCGTGTIAIEAALFAYNVPPGAARSFAFRAMPSFDDAEFREERSKAMSLADFGYELAISGSDADSGSVDAALKNAAEARGMYGAPKGDPVLPLGIRFEKKSMEECRASAPEGMILCNPPYGERVRDLAYAENLYRQMRHLKRDFPGWGMSAITTHPEFPLHFGAEPSSVRGIQNGKEKAFIYSFSSLGDADRSE